MARIDQVVGISQRQATKLRKAGIRTSQGLVDIASTRRGRTEVSKATGLQPKDLLSWVHHADLLRVKGVGAEYADLLVAAGVDTLRDLRRRNPTKLLGQDHRPQRLAACRQPPSYRVDGRKLDRCL